MFRRVLIPAALALMTGCGMIPTRGAASTPNLAARTVTPLTHRWQMRMLTATGNQLDLDFTMPNFDVKQGLDPDGRIRLLYTDRTGYFGQRDTLYAYIRLVMESGEVIEKRQAPLTRMRPLEGEPTAFRLDERFRQALVQDNPLHIEFAFFGSDRYGGLTWDSNDGKNYTFDLDTFPIPHGG